MSFHKPSFKEDRKASPGLAQPSDPESIQALVERLASPDGKARDVARSSLVRLGRPAVPTLVELLERAGERGCGEHSCWEAAKALAEIGDPAAAPAFVRALEHADAGTRWLAGEGLIDLGRDGLPVLLEAWSNTRIQYGLEKALITCFEFCLAMVRTKWPTPCLQHWRAPIRNLRFPWLRGTP